MKTTQRLAVLFAVAALMLSISSLRPAPVNAQAQGSTTKFTAEGLPFSFSDPCLGQIVSGTISYKQTVHQTLDGSGGSHFQVHLTTTIEAVGQYDGTRYTGGEQLNFGINSKGCPFTETEAYHFTLKGQGRAPDLRLRLTFHLNVNEDCQLNSFVNNFKLECK